MVEACCALDLGKYLRAGTFTPGTGTTGTLTWRDPYSGRRMASVAYRANLGRESGEFDLTCTTWGHGAVPCVRFQEIALVTAPQPFGGRRWWFVCPETGERVAKLYMPPGGVVFASRAAHRLGYHSQREAPRDRDLSRALKQHARLGGRGGIGDIPCKPKWMRWATYERELERIAAAEVACERNMAALVERLDRKAPWPRGRVWIGSA